MASINNFEDLNVWQESRKLAREVHKLIRKSDFSDDLDLRKQIKRSVGSIMDNIAEGFERGGNKEFIQFLYIAKGSSGELRSQFYRAEDFEIINTKETIDFVKRAREISSMLQGFITYLKNSGYKGDKYVLKEPKSIYKTKK